MQPHQRDKQRVKSKEHQISINEQIIDSLQKSPAPIVPLTVTQPEAVKSKEHKEASFLTKDVVVHKSYMQPLQRRFSPKEHTTSQPSKDFENFHQPIYKLKSKHHQDVATIKTAPKKSQSFDTLKSQNSLIELKVQESAASLQKSSFESVQPEPKVISQSAAIAQQKGGDFVDNGSNFSSQDSSAKDTGQKYSSLQENAESFEMPHSYQKQTLTLKFNEATVNVHLQQNRLYMQFVSQASMQLHPDMEEFISNVMQESGYEKYRVVLKDKEKRVTITSKEQKRLFNGNSSINVKV